jgi:regulator of replication initiation timing
MRIWPWIRIAELKRDNENLSHVLHGLNSTFERLWIENGKLQLELNELNERSAAVSKGNRTRAAKVAAKRAVMTKQLAAEVAARK